MLFHCGIALCCNISGRNFLKNPDETNSVSYFICASGKNILHYSAERAIVVDDISIGVGSITLMQDDAMYKISSCNLVNNDDAEEIKKRCDYIKTLDEEGLKNFYLELLRFLY